ncbi:hypothetical protein H9P43_007524 [Blastocladiella emersonii ATCC 22665]|nr:hypothetical protein H9P43_007524 [Blastocladiella emersonii ATCC 22665]
MVFSLQPGQTVHHYEVVAELGSGAFATVYTCFDRRLRAPASPDAAPLALKVISKRDLDRDQLALTRLEVDIHVKLPAHPHIVRLLEWFEDPHALYLVLERCDYGDLYDLVLSPTSSLASTVATTATPAHSVSHLYPTPHSLASSMSMTSAAAAGAGAATKSRRGLPDAVVHRYMLQITDALAACHANGVYHRDLKPENVLLAGPLARDGFPSSTKLADFGLATREAFSTELGLGTRSYLAPECLDEKIDGYASAAADVFALALVALQLAHPGVRLWKATVDDDADWAAFCRALHDQRHYVRTHAGHHHGHHGHRGTSHAAEPLARFFAARFPQISPALQRLLARALDPVPARRATLAEFRRLLAHVDAFACKHTPSLLVASIHAKHAPRVRIGGGGMAADLLEPEADAAGVPHVPLPAGAVHVDIGDMDFGDVMAGHGHDDDGDDYDSDEESSWAEDDDDEELFDDEDADDDEYDGYSDDGEAEDDAVTAPAPAFAVPVAAVAAAKAALPLAGPHIFATAAAASPRPWTSMLAPVAAALAPPKPVAAAAVPALALAPPSVSSSHIDWSELDEDDDAPLAPPTTTASRPTLPTTSSSATLVPSASTDDLMLLKVPAAVADAAKQRQESLDSALGHSITAGVARLRV